MKKKPTKKKRNPSDLTKRNNDARKKEIAELKEKLNEVIGFVNGLLDLSFPDTSYRIGVVK